MKKYTCPVYASGTTREVDRIEVDADNIQLARGHVQMILIASDHDWHKISMGRVEEASDLDLGDGDTCTLYG